MDKIDNNIRISQLIAREVNYELTREEKLELDNWLNESKENLDLYYSIRNREKFLDWDQRLHQINIVEGWNRFESTIKPRRNIDAFKTVLRYAAVILIPLFLSGIGYYIYTDLSHLPEQYAKVNSSKQSKSKARLILADGSKVNLENEENVDLKEKDGTLIERNAGSLKYQNRANAKSNVLYNTVEIPNGANYQLCLTDGTTVYLNSMSALKFPTKFSGKTREVQLTGEAYFEVAKDREHPFLVNVSGTRIEVLGTSFNVKAYSDESEIVTTLVEGNVKVNASVSGKSTLLKPGQQAVVDDKMREILVQDVDVDLFTSWKEGIFLFKAKRLEDIMNELTRWYDLKVFYMNPVVKDLRFGGHFNKDEEIESIMEMFELTRKINVEVNGRTILISAK
ncbi:FecR family protein [Marinifilum sp. D714]|uniref:FecR family protein n=1 Tax=Marinifilum sp. D714 TaxID=2937523 RepID=UPI0027C78A98|nr:FecR domain-containing protein [Marinifilum sp. D714]MDQ2180113.1 FecR domain-containing protein [Marinifilum sp. D714]